MGRGSTGGRKTAVPGRRAVEDSGAAAREVRRGKNCLSRPSQHELLQHGAASGSFSRGTLRAPQRTSQHDRPPQGPSGPSGHP